MKDFLSLPQEKQNKIIASAMTLFADVGFKKTYVSEIAASAGISEALIFSYFGCKKDLYSYLVDYTDKIIKTEAQSERDIVGMSFFERVITTIRFRLAIKSRFPAMNSFIESVHIENDEEVADDVDRLFDISKMLHLKVELEIGEETLLKKGVDPIQVVNLVDNYCDGILLGWNHNIPLDDTMHNVKKCMDMLQANLFV